MKRLFLSLLLLSSVFYAKAQYDNHWVADPYLYANNMTAIGVICFNGDEQRSESLEIGAFCGEECRGSSIAVYEEMFDRYFIYIMIYGEHDDEITFRCYDHRLNLELDLIQETSINFQINGMIGTIVDPFIFSFQTYQYKISFDLLPEVGGIVTGEGTYDKYDTCFINILPNEGYQLDGIVENGDTLTKQNNYSFIVLSDRYFEVCFSEIPIYYQITAETNPSTGGYVIGTGQYLEEDNCDLHVTANPGYIYEGLYENEQLITLDSIYTFEVDANRHFVAKFSLQINYYQITADISPNEAGTITGLGAYQEGEICEMEIIANEGYYFKHLKENDEIISIEPNYSFTVEADRHFVAEFMLQEFEISLSVNPVEGGSVSGGGTYKYGSTVYAIANPNEDYVFLNWTNEDGSVETTNSQYVFDVTGSRNLIANFAYVDNVSESEEETFMIYPNPASDFIIIINDASRNYDVVIYDLTGKIIIKENIKSEDNRIRIDISNIPNGMYVISIDNVKSRFVINN